MSGELYIGTDKKQLKQIIDDHTDQAAETSKTQRIIAKYSSQYPIQEEVAIINGQRVHVDYLPTIDAILEQEKEVVGAALYKVELDQCLFLTDTRDLNLQDIYSIHQKQADKLADKLLKLNTEEFPCQWTHTHAAILSGSFGLVFGQTYGNWRKSLDR